MDWMTSAPKMVKFDIKPLIYFLMQFVILVANLLWAGFLL